MKAHIRWIFFEREDSSKLIRNEENNENWPNDVTYINWLNQSDEKIKAQQQEINLLEIKNRQTRQLMANVQTWFINEYNLLGKPIKRTLIEILAKLKKLERSLKIHENELNNPKEKLAEHEKKCLKTKIRVDEKKISDCKSEIDEIEKFYREEKKELCKRLTYTREDLEPYLRNPEERIDPITRKLLINSKDYRRFCEDFIDFHPESEPLAKLDRLLDEWETHNGGKGLEPNPYEIWLEERTDDSLTFVWKLVEQELINMDDEGNEIKIKGKFLSLLKNYLFNYYGEWFEVSDYQQTNYNTIIVECQKSIFYNYYWELLKCQANVIVHHAPPEIARQEICSCPSYEVYTSRNVFELDYELKFDLYKMTKDELKDKGFFPQFPIIFAGVPKRVDNFEDEHKRVNNTINGFWSSLRTLKKVFLGEEGIMYSLLGQNLNSQSFSRRYFTCPSSREGKTGQDLYFKRIGDWDRNRGISNLQNETKGKFLKERGITLNDEDERSLNLKNPMFHPLSQHIRGTLEWRNKPIWKGNYYLLHEQMAITESISAAGNAVTIEASGLVLARVRELVTAKIGGDDKTKGFLSMMVTTATTIAAQTIAPGVGGAVAAAATKAGINLVGGMSQMAINQNMSTPSYEEVNQTMSIHEFYDKYMDSGERPLKLVIEYCQELFDQYLNKRELKGPMLYTYKNLENFGDLFARQGENPSFFLKASVISLNMSNHSEWFREKIERGVYIYDENHQDFYQRKLTGQKTAISRGGITRKTWDQFVSMTSCGVKGGYDAYSHQGGGFWVYKRKEDRPNFIRPRENNNVDFLPIIMQELKTKYPNFIVEEDEFMWTVNHPEPTFTNYQWDIPEQYKTETLENGEKTCDLVFRLDFFSGGDESKEGEKFSVTHILISKESLGNQSSLLFNFVGEIVRKVSFDNLTGIPPSTQLPTDPNQTNIPPSTPFTPNQFAKSGNLTSSPTGSGETEINVPDVDNSADPDFGGDIDDDFNDDVDPTKDDDNNKDDDDQLPPDNPFDTGDND